MFEQQHDRNAVGFQTVLQELHQSAYTCLNWALGEVSTDVDHASAVGFG